MDGIAAFRHYDRDVRGGVQQGPDAAARVGSYGVFAWFSPSFLKVILFPKLGNRRGVRLFIFLVYRLSLAKTICWLVSVGRKFLIFSAAAK